MDAWKAVAAVAGAGTAIGCAAMGPCGRSTASPSPYPFGYCLFDIDGTISSARGKVSPRVVAALRAVRARGAAVILATGRPPPLAGSVAAKVDGELDFLLCCNGACAFQVAPRPGSPAGPPDSWVESAPPCVLPGGAKLENLASVLSAAVRFVAHAEPRYVLYWIMVVGSEQWPARSHRGDMCAHMFVLSGY
jgi:hypothetical protein